MSWTPSQITGEPGELIETFSRLLRKTAGQESTVGDTALFRAAVSLDVNVPTDSLKDRDAIAEIVQTRATHLVSSGVSESFLVRALRDNVSDTVAKLTDLERINQSRSDLLDRGRNRLSDAVIAGLQPVNADADKAKDGWVARDLWEEASSENLSDEVIERWEDMSLSKLLRKRQEPDELAFE